MHRLEKNILHHANKRREQRQINKLIMKNFKTFEQAIEIIELKCAYLGINPKEKIQYLKKNSVVKLDGTFYFVDKFGLLN